LNEIKNLDPSPNYDQEEINKYISMTTINAKNNHYILLGDNYGYVHSYYKNGTFVNTHKVTKHSLIGLHKHYPNALFSSKK